MVTISQSRSQFLAIADGLHYHVISTRAISIIPTFGPLEVLHFRLREALNRFDQISTLLNPRYPAGQPALSAGADRACSPGPFG